MDYFLLLLLASGLPQSNHFPTCYNELPTHIEGFKSKISFPSILLGLVQRQYSKESLYKAPLAFVQQPVFLPLFYRPLPQRVSLTLGWLKLPSFKETHFQHLLFRDRNYSSVELANYNQKSFLKILCDAGVILIHYPWV